MRLIDLYKKLTALGVPEFVRNSNGDVVGLAGPNGLIRIGENQAQLGTALFEPGSGVAPVASIGAGCSNLSSGFVTEDGEQWFYATATANSVSNNYMEIAIPTFAGISADSAVVEYMTDPGQGSAMTMYLGTTAYAKFALSANWTLSAPAQNDPFQHYGRSAATFNSANWTKNGYTEATKAVPWTVAKLRIPITNGQTRTFKLRSIRVGATKRKGRICIVADDGYSSWLRLGLPIFEAYGLVTTSAIIADKVGSSSLYGSLADWHAYVDRGHECVPHGPFGGTGNVIDNFATNPLRVADACYHRDFLVNNSLADAAAAKCYVWAQGKYSPSPGDISLLDDMYAAGFRIGRAATVKTFSQQQRALSPRSHQRLIAPIIGHTYAGATNTADDAAETTNINAIVASIQAIALARTDDFLMVHKFVGRGAATAGDIEMETDRAETLAAAMRVEVDAGRLEVVRMSEMK